MKEGECENPIADEEQRTEQSQCLSEEPGLLCIIAFRFIVDETETEETKKSGPDPPAYDDQGGRLCPETFHCGRTLAVCVGAAGGILAVLVDGVEGLGLSRSIVVVIEPGAINNHFIHLVVRLPGGRFAHTMRSIHGTAVQNGGRRGLGPVTKSPLEVVPMYPEPTLVELGLPPHGVIDAILFGDHWRWEPLIVGGQFQFGAVVPAGGTDDGIRCAFGGRPKRRGGAVGTCAGGMVEHKGSPRNLGWGRLKGAPYEQCSLEEETEFVVDKRRSHWDQGPWLFLFSTPISFGNLQSRRP